MFYNENLIDITEELLLTHLVRLPRVIYTGTEEQKIGDVSLLRKIIILLFEKDRLRIILSSADIIEKLLSVLLSAVQLEKSYVHVDICEDIWHMNDNYISQALFASPSRKAPWKMYKNSRDQQFVNDIDEICKYISKNDRAYVYVLEFLIKMIQKNSDKSNEVLVIIQMLLSHSFKINDTCGSLHILILENLLCEKHWKILTDTVELDKFNIHCVANWEKSNETFTKHGIHETPLGKISSKILKTNILHTCLVIETVGCYAKELHRMQYEHYVMKILHLIFTVSASKQYLIQASVFHALEYIREAYSLNTISDLVQMNSDYLIHLIAKSLTNPDSIYIAINILKTDPYTDSTSFETNMETIISILIRESTKTIQFSNSSSFIYAFKLVLSTIHNNSLKSSSIFYKEKSEQLQKVKKSYEHFEIWMRILIANENSHHQNKIKIVEQKKEHKLNARLNRLAATILKQIIPVITTEKIDLKMLALDTMSIGLDIIKDDENELLPCVHLIWDKLIQQCFRANDSYWLQLYLKVIAKLTNYAQSFVEKRITR